MTPILGHEKRWAALARAFARGMVPHTILISGPPHVGKSRFVRRYAQLLLCRETVIDGQGLPAPCGHCAACHQIDKETFPDFRIFRPLVGEADEKDWVIASEFLESSVITVGVTRKFNREAGLSPLSGPRKVLWLSQVDRMNESAQNAALKTFEEPSPGTTIILTTDNAKRLKETIMSRCWHLKLTPVPDAVIEPWLRDQFPEASYQLIAESLRAADGRPGAAWRQLETAAKNEEKNGKTRFAQVSELLDKIDRCTPVGALGLTEETLKLSKLWWQEDAGDDAETKKSPSKAVRAGLVRFLDELMAAGRARWINDPEAEAVTAARLDLIRKTRHYILRNVNANLALDVLFSRLISLRPRPGAMSKSVAGRARV